MRVAKLQTGGPPLRTSRANAAREGCCFAGGVQQSLPSGKCFGEQTPFEELSMEFARSSRSPHYYQKFSVYCRGWTSLEPTPIVKTWHHYGSEIHRSMAENSCSIMLKQSWPSSTSWITQVLDSTVVYGQGTDGLNQTGHMTSRNVSTHCAMLRQLGFDNKMTGLLETCWTTHLRWCSWNLQNGWRAQTWPCCGDTPIVAAIWLSEQASGTLKLYGR